MSKLSHLDETGQARMVDVGDKQATARSATAKGRVVMAPETLKLIEDGGAAQEGILQKGDVLGAARLAGIMGAKRTSELIPLCHPLGLDQITVDLICDAESASVEITATAKLTAKTGVEMEALTAVSVAALTVYDMVKAADKAVRITDIRLTHKSGGKSGSYDAE